MTSSKKSLSSILRLRQGLEPVCLLKVFSAVKDSYFFMKDKDGRFIGANDAQVKKLGLSCENDLLGKTDLDFFPNYMVSQFAKDDAKVIESGEAIHDRVELVANFDGSIKWHVTSKFPLMDVHKKCVGIVGVMRDFDRSEEDWQPYRRMNAVMDYIKENYARPIEIADMAQKASLSVSQFERRFTKLFQQSPSRFLILYRLTRASVMLMESEDTLGKIALEVGFYDQSHFSREFQKCFGQAPGQYRKEHK